MTHHDEGPGPLDADRSPEQAAEIRQVAADVAARHGADLTRMRRAHGFTNSTWVGDGIAVRVADAGDAPDRGARLLRALPRGVGHPEVLDAGTTAGHGWVVTAQVAGENLAEAWPRLGAAERVRAVRELWGRVEALHDAAAHLGGLVATHGTGGTCWRRSTTRGRGPSTSRRARACPVHSARGWT